MYEQDDVKTFEFYGNAREWFGIWIVNVLLTIVTIGIYSAWAKVRTKKYFYQNTYIADRNFDYHATGKQILIGRLIVLGAFLLLAFAGSLHPVIYLALTVGLLFAFPFLLSKSLQFNARMSSWSNVRFAFDGTAMGMFKAYMLFPFLAFFTLFLAYPFVERAQREYVTGKHRLGQAKFHLSTGVGLYYRASAVLMVCIMAIGVLTASRIQRLEVSSQTSPQTPGLADAFVLFLPAAITFICYFGALVIYRAMIRNIMFNNAILNDSHSFRSTIQPVMMAWIAVSNAVVVLLTLGLMLPWAQIRMARYVAANTYFVPHGSLDDFVSDELEKQSAIGDAYTDFEGIDFGLT